MKVAAWRAVFRSRLQWRSMNTPIEVSEEHGVRYLHFGSSWVQGAMRIARPWSLELSYTREMMAALLLRSDRDWPRTVLSIGLGSASLTKFIYRHRPRAKQTVIEIAPQVVAAARQFFKLPYDPARVQIEIADGLSYVAGTRRRFDLILVDGFYADACAGAFNTLPFYLLCRSRLSEHGVLAVNLLRRHRAHKIGIATLGNAFAGRAIAFPTNDEGNTIAFAAAGKTIRLSFEMLVARAERLKHETGLNLMPVLQRWMTQQVATQNMLHL